jgi:AraC family transcriptional regulator
VLHANPAVLPALRIVRELQSVEPLSRFVIEACLAELLASMSPLADKIPAATPAWLPRAIEALHDLPVEELSLARLAKAAGIHRIHLAKAFKRRFGISIGTYARRQRTLRAIDRIVNTRARLSDIGVDCGFCDQSHMSRFVKAATGFTPRSLREQLGAGRG